MDKLTWCTTDEARCAEGLFLPSQGAAPTPASIVALSAVPRALCTLLPLSWPNFSGSLELRQLLVKVRGTLRPGFRGGGVGSTEAPGSSGPRLCWGVSWRLLGSADVLQGGLGMNPRHKWVRSVVCSARRPQLVTTCHSSQDPWLTSLAPAPSLCCSRGHDHQGCRFMYRVPLC